MFLSKKKREKKVTTEKYDFEVLTLHEKPQQAKKAWKMSFNAKSQKYLTNIEAENMSVAIVDGNVYIGYNYGEEYITGKITKSFTVSSATFQEKIRDHFELGDGECEFELIDTEVENGGIIYPVQQLQLITEITNSDLVDAVESNPNVGVYSIPERFQEEKEENLPF